MDNRVIKFRAWYDGRMIKESFCEYLSGYGCMFNQFTKPDALMQFTGLYDSKGVEIYEGDIIRMEGGSCYDMEDPDPFTRQVMWCNNTGALTHFRIDGKPSGSGLTWCRNNAEKCFSVIGNIYETPELLERDA